jgi:hypothetical protein
MAEYDIIQIDDAPFDLSDMKREAESAGLSYLSGSTLYDLGQILRQNDAGVWFIDGVFPRRSGERPQKSGDLVVHTIQRARENARIILYSTIPEDFIELAESGVKLERKEVVWPKELVAEIRRMLV